MRRTAFRARDLVVGVSLAFVPVTASAAEPAVSAATLEQLEIFMDVFERVKATYVKPVDDATLIKGAIDGMLSALDPHSNYAEGADFADLRTISDGNYGGLGLLSTVEDGLLKVVSVTEDTPAWKAGIKPGDYITHLDGQLMYGMKLDEAVAKMRGKPGSTVRVTIRSQGSTEPKQIQVARAVIDVNPVKWEVQRGVGIINLNIFNGKSAEATREAIVKINEATKGGPLGYILDLRSNGGGVLQEAVDIADLFLEQGEIVSQRGRDNGSIQRFYANPGDLAGGRPVIVLVDAGSASASEIVAGALQEHRRALVLGDKSFGKGSVQSVFVMGPDRALKLTTDLYYLPSGRSIQAGGIEPDIAVPQLSDATRLTRLEVREADLRRHLLAQAGDDDALIARDDPPSARFMISAADLKKQGVNDFQLKYAIDVIARVPGTYIAEDQRKKRKSTSG